MSPRQLAPLPFGGAVDRATGLGAEDGSGFADLRNVHLERGRVRARRGLVSAGALGAGVVVGLFPVRALGVGAALLYDAGTGAVALYRTNADGSNPVLVGTAFAVAAGSAPPVVRGDDAYGRLYLAHDEPDVTKRGATVVWDAAAGTFAPLAADLNTASAGAGVVRFRGVRRHLNYLVGWGWGTEDAPDRPEVVRISDAGEPSTFRPTSYVIAGQPGEAVLDCQPGPGGSLGILKEGTDVYVLTGSDPKSFGVRLADGSYGLAGARLAIAVAGVVYYWSPEGPRAWAGGASEDLGLALDLRGTPPDALALGGAQATDVRLGFVRYLPGPQEVEWVFGRFGYALALRADRGGANGDARWSYRVYAQPLTCGALFYPTTVVAGGPTSSASAVTLAFGTGAAGRSASIGWTNGGAVAPGTLVEVWTRPAGGAWSRSFDPASTNPQPAAFPAFSTTYEAAVRHRLNGRYGPGYVSSNPSDWPAAARGSGTSGAEPPPPAGATPTLNPVTSLGVQRAGNVVTLSWGAGDNPGVGGVSYVIYEGTEGNLGTPPSRVVEQVAGTTYTYETADGAKGHWLVAKKDGYTDSALSNGVQSYGTSTGGGGGTLTPPSDFIATAVTFGGTTVRCAWSLTGPAGTTYTVYQDGGAVAAVVDAGAVEVFQDPNTTRAYYVVLTKDGFAPSGPSNVDTATTAGSGNEV